MQQSWVQALISQQIIGASLTNTAATATSIISLASKVTIPANFFAIGSVLRVTLTGQISNVVTTPGTLTLDFMLGSVIAFTTGAMQMSTTVHTTLPFWWDLLLTCRAIGASTTANFMGQSKIHGQMMLTSGADITTHGTLLGPNTTPAVGTGWDSTTAQVTDIKATTSVGTAGTIITGQQLVIESLN